MYLNQKYIATLVGVVVIGALGFFLMRPAATSQSSPKLAVTASFYPVYFFASQVGGDKVSVENITPADAEPHDYEPSPQQVANIESGRVLVLNGGVEAWGDRLKRSIDPSKTLVITAGEGLETQQVEEDGAMQVDPHIWQSPLLAKQMVDKIEKGLAQADPVNASSYAANAETLKSKLDQLDSEFTQGLASCAKKDFITSHAAFGYLATTYHLNQVSIAGLSPDAEPSAKDLAGIADFAKKNDVKVIFFESLVSPKLSQTIASEIGAQTLVLDPIEGLVAEDLAAGKDYFSQMRQNLANLKIALECQ